MRIRLESIGCRLNIAEMEHLCRQFAAAGHRIVGPGDDADLCIFNTCAVTHVATRKSRKVLRQIRRRLPQVRLVATGCFADLAADEVAALDVDLVVSNADKDRLPEILADAGILAAADPLPEPSATPYPSIEYARTRAFVKVQDGCDNRCTFCIVTVARGVSRSRPVAAVVGEVRDLVESGFQEVVLSGVHLGAYGQDLGDRVELAELVRRLLSETKVLRLRLSSLEPWDLSPGFFDVWDDPRLLPHLHLPLQSGCDATLLRMARRTDQESFSRLVQAARDRIPRLALTTDVIVGFPGEDDAEFEESAAYIEHIGFAGLHIFRYSPREGTAAYRMPGRVEADIAQARSRRMHALGAELEHRFRTSNLGRTVAVLWDGREEFDTGVRWSGLTDNYLRVVTDTVATVDLHNRVLPTELTHCLPGALYGRTEVTDPNTAFAWETALAAPSGLTNEVFA